MPPARWLPSSTACTLPEMARYVILKQFQGRALESLKALLGETGVAPRKVAVETIEFPFELTMELVEGLGLSYYA